MRTFELKEAVLSLLLIPYVPVGANTSPVLAVGWTLSFEMYFYALVVCIGLCFSRKVFLIGLGLFFLATTVVFPQNHGAVSGLTANMILWEFYAGVLLYEVYRLNKRLPVCVAVVCGIASLVALFHFSHEGLATFRFVYWGIPSLVLVASALALEAAGVLRVPRSVVFLGDSSYALYLSNLITLPAIAKVFTIVGLHTILPPDVQIIMYTFACVAVGGVLYIMTENLS